MVILRTVEVKTIAAIVLVLRGNHPLIEKSYYIFGHKCILFDHLLYSTSPVTTELEMSLMMLILMPFSNKSAIDIDYPFFEKTLQIKLNISITYI